LLSTVFACDVIRKKVH